VVDVAPRVGLAAGSVKLAIFECSTVKDPVCKDAMKSGDPLPVSSQVSARCTLAILILCSVAFTLVGSLVPFEFRSRPIKEVGDSFAWAMANRIAIQSRSDGIANVLLGVPLGFSILGIACVQRCLTVAAIAMRVLIALIASMAFAAIVEFLQLYAPLRTCCASDVLAQGVGAMIGMGVWLEFGQRWMDSVHGIASGGGPAGHFLSASFLLLAFTQALPFDLSLSPYEAYYKFHNGGVRTIPFQELQISSCEENWARAASQLKLAALYLPVGLFAGVLSARFWALRQARIAVLASGVLAVILESAQILVRSRTTSATEALIGAGATLIGWWLTVRRCERGWPGGLWPILLASWLAALAVASLQPFAVAEVICRFDWVPGSPLQSGNPLVALDEMLGKLVLFGLGGALVASTGFDELSGRVLVAALCVGLSVAAACEIAQLSMAGQTSCITDVILGGVGALGGAWITIAVSRADRKAGVQTDG
jgi:VanZ family protein